MNNQRDVMVALPSLLIVVAVAVGIYSLPPALDSTRPDIPQAPLSATDPIPARLWQDPLQAIWDLPSGGSDHLLPADRVLEGRLGGPGRTLVLPVLIPGSGYSESYETRLRLRYAVLTALGASGFVPEQAERIGAFSAPKMPAGGLSCWPVPFEWHRYRPSGSNADLPVHFEQVLVLWVNEEALGDSFLAGLHQLLHALLGGGSEKLAPCPDAAGLCVEVIGPTSSTGFNPYLVRNGDREGQSQGGDEAGCQASVCPLKDAHLNSPLATTWDDSAVFRLPYSILLRRTIGSDLQLCKLLKWELGLRGVEPSAQSRIVLITEWDTVYGRTFPDTFQSLYDASQRGFIHEFTYLRGIDGQVPGAKKGGASSNGGSSPAAGVLSPAQIERPEGRSQFDYLRRMERQLEAIRSQGEVRAIGVTGTDVYDKLLILHALRSNFPDSLIFTTDLDVRLLHPNDYDSARNLIIASHFSLGLGEDLAAPVAGQQGGLTLEDQFKGWAGNDSESAADRRKRRVPLFRYSYQSSVFLAALESLNPSALREPSAPASHARLYEVGRNGGILLNAASQHNRGSFGPVAALIVLMASVGLSFLRPDLSQLRRDLTEEADHQPPRNIRALLIRKASQGASLYLGWLLLRLLPFGILGAIALLDSRRSDGEAWTLFQGVSLWPSQFLLLLIVMLAIEFSILLAKNFEASKLRLDLAFFSIKPGGWQRSDLQFNLPEGFTERVRFCWQELKEQALSELQVVGTFASAARDNPDHRWGRTDVASLWQDYRRRTAPGAVLLRLLLYAWLVIPVSALIFYFAPARPFRGEMSHWVDSGLLAAALLSIGFLLVLVWDVTFYTSLFTHGLAGRESLWPKETVQAYSKEGWPAESYTGELLNEWLDVNFIAFHSKAIGRFIYFPFILLLLYGIAHQPVFDNWVIRPQEVLIFVGAMALAAVPLIIMRRSAESARRQARQRLSVKTLEAQGQPDSGLRLKILERCQDDIDSIRQGAFSSLAENPLLRAALIPFGGMGGLALLEYLLL